jgi:FAD/FMN-containing dehydrogenase
MTMQTLRVMTNSERVATLDEAVIAEFKQSLRGELITPSDQNYDQMRKLWNGMIDKHPAMIARCTGAADVVSAVNFARDHRLLLSVRGGGHNVAGKAMCDDGLVIDLSLMRVVHVDLASRTVRVQGGARLGDIDHETAPFNLAVPIGLVSQTGIAGLCLHGGVGWLTRKYGLALDNLLSVDIVTADGQLRRASESENEDLFWAVRGGGGNFGIVTSFEFRAYPIPEQIWFAAPIYPVSQAKQVLRFVSDFMEDAPEELGAIAIFWNAPKHPRVPAEHQGEPVIIVPACYHGPFEKGEEAIAPLRRIGTPIADLSGPMRFADLQKFLDEDYPDGMLYYWKSLYLTRLDDEVFDALAGHATARPSPLSSIDVWYGAGALNRVGPDETAFARRDIRYMLAMEANWTSPDDSDANIAWARRCFEDMQRFARGSYLNFPGFMEDGDKLLQGAYEDNYERLGAIKAKYDPENLFRGALNIAPK